jgi:hypothetical protein
MASRLIADSAGLFVCDLEVHRPVLPRRSSTIRRKELRTLRGHRRALGAGAGRTVAGSRDGVAGRFMVEMRERIVAGDLS